MTADLSRFEEIWGHDFEFYGEPGELPEVVCLCAREFRSGRTIRLRWRDGGETHPAPYRTDDKVLFVNYVANAECLCHLTLGWPLPRNVLDLSPVFRAHINGREPPAEGKGLIGALSHFGFPTDGGRHKDAMRKRILEGRPYSEDDWGKILDYCMSDVDDLGRILMPLLETAGIDLETALHWGEFAMVSAVMQHNGVPIDMETFAQLRDEATWNHVRDALVPTIDAQYGVYTLGPDGGWHFSIARFDEYLVRNGIDWPRKESGKLDLQRKTFEAMSKAVPELEPLRQLRCARDQMRKIGLAVGKDGRNRTVLWPFKSKTSRTQPAASEWIFSPSTWLRSVIKPGPGRAIAYVDWSSMEFFVGGVLSGCQPMLDLYNTGKPYLAFAGRMGAAPPDATKETHPHIHQRYKVGCLGIQYAMQTATLAMRLGLSYYAAHELLDQHRGLFNQYWRWIEDWIAHSLDTGLMTTAMGWPMRTGITEFNIRSIGNWPVQSTSSDIMRLACVWAHRRGLKLCGCVHDALLIEAPIGQIEANAAAAEEIMRRASRVVLGGHELRTDATIVRYPDRYSDPRGEEIWRNVLGLLDQRQKEVG